MLTKFNVAYDSKDSRAILAGKGQRCLRLGLWVGLELDYLSRGTISVNNFQNVLKINANFCRKLIRKRSFSRLIPKVSPNFSARLQIDSVELVLFSTSI